MIRDQDWDLGFATIPSRARLLANRPFTLSSMSRHRKKSGLVHFREHVCKYSTCLRRHVVVKLCSCAGCVVVCVSCVVVCVVSVVSVVR